MTHHLFNSAPLLTLLALGFSSTAAAAYQAPSKLCAVEGFLSFDIAMLRGSRDVSKEVIDKTFEFLGPSISPLIDQQFEREAKDSNLTVYQLALTRMWDRSDACTEDGPHLKLSSKAIDELYKQGEIAQQTYRRLNQ